MESLTIFIDRELVYAEVAQTSSYSGAKMTGDAEAYDRIYTTDADRTQLARFWDEACVELTEALKEFVTETRNEEAGLRLRLEAPAAFVPTLLPAVKEGIFSFFVQSITGKWYVFVNKAEAGAFGAVAGELLDGVRRKIYHRRKPTRPGRRMNDNVYN